MLNTKDTFECSFDTQNIDKLLRATLGQGRYNSMKLKQDGYLSPKNSWYGCKGE